MNQASNNGTGGAGGYGQMASLRDTPIIVAEASHKRKCLEVLVRFNSPNHQTVRVSRTSGDTRTQYLEVEQTPSRLTISFCDKDGDIIQSINYNYAHVLEFTAEGYVK